MLSRSAPADIALPVKVECFNVFLVSSFSFSVGLQTQTPSPPPGAVKPSGSVHTQSPPPGAVVPIFSEDMGKLQCF